MIPLREEKLKSLQVSAPEYLVIEGMIIQQRIRDRFTLRTDENEKRLEVGEAQSVEAP